MRLILDANIIVSAALSKRSTAFLAFERCIENHVLLTSEAVFTELKSSLYKKKLEKYFFPDDTRPDILGINLKYSILIAPDVTVTACRDPKDNKYLELALSGKADCIITGDQDLLVLNPFREVAIITAADFIKRY